MLLTVLFFVSLFIAAYGNAIRKQVYRRKVLVDGGRKDVPEYSKARDRTGLGLFIAGVLGLTAWLILLVWGDPTALLNRQ